MPKTVRVEEVAPRSIEGRLTLTGTLEPASVETAIPQVNGRVAKVLVKAGNVVKGGDVVVQLDRWSLQADVKYTQAFLIKAQAQLNVLTLERSNVQTSLEQATEQLKAAQQEIAAAQIVIAQAEAAVQKLRQRPPTPSVATASTEPQVSEELISAQAAVRAAATEVATTRAAVEQSGAALAQANSEFAAADKQFQRAQILYDAGAVSRRFYESKQEAHAAAQKKVEQATAQLQERQARLAEAETALTQAQNRLNQVKAQKAIPSSSDADVNPKSQIPNPKLSDVAEVEVVVKQARDRAVQATAKAKESRATYEAAQQRVEEVEQRWQSATQLVTNAQEMLSNKAVLVGAADIHAPCDGVVTQVTAKVGDTVTAGTPLVFVAAQDQWRVRLTLPQEAVPLVEPKMSVPVKVPLTDGQEKEFVGTLERVLPSDPANVVATSVAEILVSAPGALAKVGADATCALTLGRRDDVLTVPVEAIYNQKEQTATVFVVQNGNVVQARKVTLGWTDGSRFEVVEGLASGEQVIIQSSSTLRAGDVVVATLTIER